VKYFLYGRRDQIDAGIQAQYDNVLRWFKDIGKGSANINLLLADGSVSTQGGAQVSVSPQANSQFSQSNFI